MPKLTEKQREFIAQNPYVATVTTLRPDGSPHSTIVWVDAEDGVVTFNTAVGRAKERYLRQRSRRFSRAVPSRRDDPIIQCLRLEASALT